VIYLISISHYFLNTFPNISPKDSQMCDGVPGTAKALAGTDPQPSVAIGFYSSPRIPADIVSGNSFFDIYNFRDRCILVGDADVVRFLGFNNFNSAILYYW